MAIKFTCPHSQCEKVMQVPDSMAGAAERCPRCGRPVTVPDNSCEFGEKDEAYIRAITALRGEDPEAGQTLPSDVAANRRCPQCGRLVSSQAKACPFCGTVAGAVVPAVTAEAGPAAARYAPAGGLYRDSCLQAGRYALKSFPAIVLMMFMGGLFYALLRAAVALGTLCSGEHALQSCLLVIAAGVVALYAVGYFSRFCLSIIESTLRGAADPPKFPSLNPVSTFIVAGKTLGLLAVYVVPIVTLPLLPIGLLGQSYSDDRRAYDVPWAARAAGGCAEDLGVLWLILLPAIGLIALTTVVLMSPFHSLAAAQTAGLSGFSAQAVGIVILTVGAMLSAAVTLLVLVGACRCVGMLGRHNPELIRSLRHRRQPLAGPLCLAGGLTLVALIALSMVLRLTTAAS